MADPGSVSWVSERHLLAVRRRVQVRPPLPELPCGERPSHRLLRLPQGNVANRRDTLLRLLTRGPGKLLLAWNPPHPRLKTDLENKWVSFIGCKCNFTLKFPHILVTQDVLYCYNSAQFITVMLLWQGNSYSVVMLLVVGPYGGLRHVLNINELV